MSPPELPVSELCRLCIMQVKTYSDWVIDGDYDWPPKCAACQAVIQDEDTSTTRLGCLRELLSFGKSRFRVYFAMFALSAGRIEHARSI